MWRVHNVAMLAEYVPGTKRAFNAGADVTDERKANLRVAIQEIDAMIERLERDAPPPAPRGPYKKRAA